MDQIGEESFEERKMASDLRNSVASFEALDGERVRGTSEWCLDTSGVFADVICLQNLERDTRSGSLSSTSFTTYPR